MCMTPKQGRSSDNRLESVCNLLNNILTQCLLETCLTDHLLIAHANH